MTLFVLWDLELRQPVTVYILDLIKKPIQTFYT